MSLKFRYLRADEVEARVAIVKQNGCSLLLYKDARCDMNILDETVGPLNWQRHHSRDNANCTVSVWDDDKGRWIEKEDTGTESNTEKEKGLASDSFKRACFNFGIGRELYTAPFIWIPADKCKISPKGQGFTCYDRFIVKSMAVQNGKITQVSIVNTSTNQVVFTYGKQTAQAAQEAPEEKPINEVGNDAIDDIKAKVLSEKIKKKGLAVNSILQYYKRTDVTEMTVDEWNDAMKLLDKYKDK